MSCTKRSLARRLPSKRVMWSLLLPCLAFSVLFVACEDTAFAPEAPAEFPVYDIWDASHEGDGLGLGNPYFHFLRPIGHPNPWTDFDGEFDPTLEPVVEICELEKGECQEDLLARFSTGPGTIFQSVHVFPKVGWYSVWWRTRDLNLDRDKVYRVQVFVGNLLVGYADVDVVRGLFAAIFYDEKDEYVPLPDDGVLPIRFRIEEGAQRFIGSGGGTATSDDGHWSLEVPPGALDEMVEITAMPITEGLADNVLPGTAWEFGPEELTFDTPAQLTISFDPVDLSQGMYPRLHKRVDGMWKAVEGSVADLETGTVTAPLSSFSEWAVLEGQLILTVDIQGGTGVVWIEGGDPPEACGMEIPNPCSLGVDYEEPPLEVTLIAEALGVDARFEEWSEPGDGQTCGESDSCTVVMDSDREVIAYFSMPGVIGLSKTNASFTQPFGEASDPVNATITVSNIGGRSINASPGAIVYTPDVDPWLDGEITNDWVEPGAEETLTLSILPNSLPIGDYEATVVLHDDGIFLTVVEVALTVTEGVTPATLIVHIDGGAGDVNSEGGTPSLTCSHNDEPCETEYPLGTELTLVAEETHSPDGLFENWSGTGDDFVCTTEPSCTFVMAGNREVTAHFSMPGLIVVNPSEVSFTVSYGGEVVDMTESVALENIGGRSSTLEPIQIYYSPSVQDWLDATITDLTIEPGATEFLTLTLNTGLATALDPGVYNATIPAFADGGQTGNAIQVTLTVEATGPQYVFDGTVVGRSGYLPVHLFTLADAATGNDIYPVGGADNCATTPTPPCYLFSYFDTGADIVVITSPDASALSLGSADVQNTNQDTRVRINGLATVDASTLEAPIGPYGNTDGAQAEVLDVRVGPANVSNRSDPGATLIGAPVANQVLALIDFTDVVTRGPYCEGTSCADLEAPNIQFFMPSDQVPQPGIQFQLERFGSTDPSLVDGATKGQKYFIRNVAFGHGQELVTDDQTVDEPLAFFYDTGAPRTLINTELAAALGLQQSSDGRFTSGTVECWSDVPGMAGYALDRITLFAATPGNGAYTIENAVVCVDERTTPEIRQMYADPHTGTIRRVDAVIGTNLFMYLPILFDGPGNTLGIVGQP